MERIVTNRRPGRVTRINHGKQPSRSRDSGKRERTRAFPADGKTRTILQIFEMVRDQQDWSRPSRSGHTTRASGLEALLGVVWHLEFVVFRPA